MKMKKIKILIIEDNESFLNLTKLILERLTNDLEIITSTSPINALSILNSFEFDVVVADYIMPVMNGLELLQEMRKRKNFTPFILLTGMPQSDTKRRALNLGADYYLEKTGSAQSLFATLYDLIRSCFNKESKKSVT